MIESRNGNPAEAGITAEHLAEDEPFDVQQARHTANIHAVAQIGATAAIQSLRALHRRGLADAEDLAPVHEIVALLKDGLCPALLESDREMFDILVASLPR